MTPVIEAMIGYYPRMGIRIATAAAFSVGLLGLTACGGGDEAEVQEVVQSQAPAETEEPDAAADTAVAPEAAPETATESAAAPDAAADTAAPDSAAGDSPFADALLTEDEFPLDGFTRGTVTQEAGSDGASAEEATGALEELTAGQDLSPECEEALQATDIGQSEVGDGSAVDFTGPAGSTPLPTSIALVVAPFEGDSPLDAMSNVSSACESLTIEEGGQSMTMNFNELDELDGTEIAMDISGLTVDLIFGGKSNDDVVVLAVSTGVEEADVAKVVDAQLEKVNAG